MRTSGMVRTEVKKVPDGAYYYIIKDSGGKSKTQRKYHFVTLNPNLK